MNTKPVVDDEDNQAGGPAGVARESALIAPTLEEARVLRDLSDRGAGRDFVGARTISPSLIRSMVARGFVEIRERVRGGFDIMLTAHGLKALTAAAMIIAASGCVR